MAALLADNLPVPPPNEALLALGIEGSANKVGVGLIRYVPATGAYDILANPRETYVTPPGTGFRPRETARHHQRHVVPLVQKCLREAGVAPSEIGCVCYTRGPGMGGPLRSCAVAARVLARLWRVPLVPVNHCVAHIEMGRVGQGSPPWAALAARARRRARTHQHVLRRLAASLSSLCSRLG